MRLPKGGPASVARLPSLDAHVPYLRRVRNRRGVVILTRRIVGISNSANDWCDDWSLDRSGLKGEPRLRWHLRKERALRGSSRQWPGSWDAEAALDPARTRHIDLSELNGLYFVVNGQHRVARAKRLGFTAIRVDFVQVFSLARSTPAGLRESLRALKRAIRPQFLEKA